MSAKSSGSFKSFRVRVNRGENIQNIIFAKRGLTLYIIDPRSHPAFSLFYKIILNIFYPQCKVTAIKTLLYD